MKRVITQVCQVIGAPKPANVERKFLVKDVNNINIPVKYEQFEVEQTYLVKGKGEGTKGYIYIRRRGQNGSWTYSYSIQRDIPGETEHNVYVERQISGREYVALLKQADPKRITVKKKVRCFIYNNQYFELTTFVEPNNSITWLETAGTQDPKGSLYLPDWIKIEREVTRDKEHSSYYIAKIKKKESTNKENHNSFF